LSEVIGISNSDDPLIEGAWSGDEACC
jgi:hypothetical protein